MTNIITKDQTELILKLSSLIEKVSNESIKERNAFYIGLSGGSVVKFLIQGIPKITTDFSKWKLFFCDERVVSEEDPDSTFGVYKNELLPHIPQLKEEQFVKIKQGVSAQEAAKDYIEQLNTIFPGSHFPVFDLLLLGMGPDGHTCSLFPNHPLLKENKCSIAFVTDSPKPPPARITMTYPVINNARFCVFAIAGEGKADMVKRILVEKEDLPAGRVKPKNGELIWILDRPAAKHLQQ